MVDSRKSVSNMRVSVDDIIVFFALIVTVITGSAIAHGDSTLFLTIERQLAAYTRIISVGVLIFLTIVYKRYVFSKTLLIPTIFCLFWGFDSCNLSVEHFIEVGTAFVRLVALFWLHPSILARLFRAYRKVLIALSIIGIICYLWYMIGFPGFYSITDYYTGAGTGAYYINFKVCYLFSEGSTLRLCSIFNEPGYFGTVLALVLCAEKFNFKKKGNIVLFVAGLFSLSVAFIFICAIYHVLKVYQKPKLFIPLIILVLIYLVVVPIIAQGSGVLATLAARIMLTENGISATNRSNIILDMAVLNTLSSSAILFGNGYGYVSTLDIKGGFLTYKTYILMYGLGGFFMIFIWPLKILITRYKHCIEAAFLILCVFISVYQRPDIYNYTYMTILLGGAQNIFYEKSLKEIR